MARIKNGFLGGFSGKLGTAVGYQIGDEWFLRARPRKKSFSSAELENQGKMGMVSRYLGPLKPLLKVGFKGHYTKTGGYRGAVSYTRKEALVVDDAGTYIDPALFRISGGNLPQALDPSVEALDEQQIYIRWEHPVALLTARLSDQLLVLLYDPESGDSLQWIYDAAFRREKQFQLPYHESLRGKSFDVHIGFVAGDRSAQSNSQYLGKLTYP